LVDAVGEVHQHVAVLAGVVRFDGLVQLSVFELVARRGYLSEALGELVVAGLEIRQDFAVLAGSGRVDLLVQPSLP
jgi:hypothetical protein